jgi:hypothetical protein
MERIWLTRQDRVETMTRGLASGSIAGLALAALETGAAMVSGAGAFWPWRMAASIALGPAAFNMGAGAALVAGAVVHVILSLGIGLLAAMLFEWSEWSRLHPLGETGATLGGALFGSAIWLVNFPILAGALFPWIWRQDQVVQFGFHVAFGAVLGGLLTAMGRYAAHPPDSARHA